MRTFAIATLAAAASAVSLQTGQGGRINVGKWAQITSKIIEASNQLDCTLDVPQARLLFQTVRTLHNAHALVESDPIGEVEAADLLAYLENDMQGDLVQRSQYWAKKLMAAVDTNKDDSFDLYELMENVGLGTCLPKGKTSAEIFQWSEDVLITGVLDSWSRLDMETAFKEVMEALDLAELDDCHLVERKDLEKWNAVHNELRKNGIFGYYTDKRKQAPKTEAATTEAATTDAATTDAATTDAATTDAATTDAATTDAATIA